MLECFYSRHHNSDKCHPNKTDRKRNEWFQTHKMHACGEWVPMPVFTCCFDLFLVSHRTDQNESKNLAFGSPSRRRKNQTQSFVLNGKTIKRETTKYYFKHLPKFNSICIRSHNTRKALEPQRIEEQKKKAIDFEFHVSEKEQVFM